MADVVKYSIPKNYNVQEYNGLKGIMRKDKKGEHWLWNPMYKHIIVGKSYGKILIAYLSAMTDEDFFRVSNYKGELAISAKVYDILFGENALYIRTERGNGDIEWCLVNEDLTGGKFIGDFEVKSRPKHMPFHIPINTETLIINVDGEDKLLKVHTGEIVDMPVVKVTKPVEEVITHYSVAIDEESKVIQLLHTKTNKILKQSTAIGEIEVYTEILKAMLGGFENVPRDRAEKLMTFLSCFEHFGNAIALPVIFEYVKARVSGDIDAILTGMLSELSRDWVKVSNYSIKVYTSGSIIVALVKTDSGRITIAPYMINGEDGILEIQEVEALIGCYKETGTKTAKLSIAKGEVNEVITDEEELTQWMSPYSVRQRPNFASNVKDSKYQKVDIIVLTTQVTGKDNKNYGEIIMTVAVCDRFTYRSKQKVKGKIGDWITTNTCSAQVI